MAEAAWNHAAASAPISKFVPVPSGPTTVMWLLLVKVTLHVPVMVGQVFDIIAPVPKKPPGLCPLLLGELVLKRKLQMPWPLPVAWNCTKITWELFQSGSVVPPSAVR